MIALFSFGRQLDSQNRWLKIAGLIPWEKPGRKYSGFFPIVDGQERMVALGRGSFLLKPMSGKSGQEVVLELLENPYWQSFVD